MKPSALKNELIAALHFIKFVKRSRNLAVTDAAFSSSFNSAEGFRSTSTSHGKHKAFNTLQKLYSWM